jgi:hypothetical protein
MDSKMTELDKQVERRLSEIKPELEQADRDVADATDKRDRIKKEYDLLVSLKEERTGVKISRPVQVGLFRRVETDFSKLTIMEATLLILQTASRPMSALEIAEEMARRGRPIGGSHARDIVLINLNKFAERLDKTREGRKIFYALKKSGTEE